MCKAKERYEEVTESISAKEAQSTRLSEFIKRLEAQDGILTKFDERLWSCMVEYITVGRKKEMIVRFITVIFCKRKGEDEYA